MHPVTGLSFATTAAIAQTGFKLVEHSPYFLNLTLAITRFQNIKGNLCGKRFSSENDVKNKAIYPIQEEVIE